MLRGAEPRRPNILLILADDMGFSDAGCFGGEIDTPNLDGLARRGIRFSQAYSTARCMPSRGCLLSGFYSQQSGLEQRGNAKAAPWVRFLPQYLKPQGYRTYHSGKWHIGGAMPLRDTGFDRSYYLGDQDRFFSPTRHFLDDRQLEPVKPGDGYYATTAIADRAVEWLQSHQRDHSSKPFFLYTAFTAPHFPLHGLAPDIERFQDRYRQGWDVVREQRWQRARKMGIVNCRPAPLEPGVWPPWNTSDADLARRIGAGEVMRAVPWKSLTPEQKQFQSTKMAIHAAMVYRMDAEIGRLLGQLRAMNAMRDTVIVFLSDNGASAEMLIRADGHDAAAAPGSARSHLCLGPGWSSAANSPFRLHKSWNHEGGISSPMIVHWPAGISGGGGLRRTPCHFIDILPTFVDLAGGGKAESKPGSPPLPGRSLVPALARDNTIPRENLFFHHLDNRALRVGDWKVVSAGPKGPWELYDLKTDRGETTNLAEKHPDRLAEMTRQWEKLETEFVAQSKQPGA